MRRIFISTCLLLFVFTGSAWAGDIVATWKYIDGSTITLSARDDQHIRLDTANDSYTLLTGGKTYAVQKTDEGWQAIDMDKMASMMGGMLGGGQKKINVDDYKTTYKYTGRKETIAGYKGKIYRVEVKDGSGKVVSSDELVLSKSKDIRRVNMAMVRISSKSFGGAMSGLAKSTEEAQKQADQYGSVLSYGKDMKLVAVKKISLKSSHFELPTGTTQREVKAPPKVPQQTTAGANGKKGGFFGDLFKSSKDAAKDQTKTDTTGEVREGVNKLFKSIFKKD